MINLQKIEHGVQIGLLEEQLFLNISRTGDSGDLAVMELAKGKAIKEHTHGNSMYFSENVAQVTIEGKKYELPERAWVFIPSGVSHGWAGVKKEGIGRVLSYHPDHKSYTLVPN